MTSPSSRVGGIYASIILAGESEEHSFSKIFVEIVFEESFQMKGRKRGSFLFFAGKSG
jgi:hypothetical protein